MNSHLYIQTFRAAPQRLSSSHLTDRDVQTHSLQDFQHLFAYHVIRFRLDVIRMHASASIPLRVRIYAVEQKALLPFTSLAPPSNSNRVCCFSQTSQHLQWSIHNTNCHLSSKYRRLLKEKKNLPRLSSSNSGAFWIMFLSTANIPERNLF